ncbi:hypothetical protein [Pseudidiomarina mangrovi]|uniref:hypothetical protein n=1 Tax=Pseudidiomarina mangrovi TaxID=2487133 RepID=UPI000FCB206E|nr:hypothetical protein [Pseudidiomarina mangrovi]CAI8162946.1 MAG: Uncharacterised protein [Pseudidiomarina mangrovi]
MVNVRVKPDTLDAVNGQFEQPILLKPVFLNSVPKCGTHLIKNIFRMFVPVNQQYQDAFVQLPILQQNISAFNPLQPKLSWGHLLFNDTSAAATQHAHHLVMVRDPYDWVIARARFFLSDNFDGNMQLLKSGRISVEEILNLMIFGIYQKAPTLADIFNTNSVAWLGTGVTLVRYEDLIKHLKKLDSDDAEAYFHALLCPALGLEKLPSDWRKRVKVGSDREQSGTYRDNLTNINIELPERLPEMQQRLVDFAAPGLRAMLGYC